MSIEKEIIQIIKANKKEKYQDIIRHDQRMEVFMALSTIRRNIINWYPFNKDSSILEINAEYGEITEELCEKLKKVTSIEESKEKAEAIEKRLKEVKNLEIIVGSLQDIKLKEKFDYILINGLEEKQTLLEEYLQFAGTYLKEEGTILFTTDNQFGLKTYNTNCQYQDDKKYISKGKIEEILKKFNYNNFKFYYPLPNYKTPNVIFTDKHLPSTESILRDLTLYDEKDILVFDERKKYKEIIKENLELFKFFANSYLVEVSKQDNNIEFVSFGNSRKEEYRMKTVILDNKVYKQNIDEKGKEHLNAIKQNIETLKQLGINTLDSFDNEKIYSRLIREEKTLDKVLIRKYDEGKKEEFNELITRFVKEIGEKLQKDCSNEEKNVFEKYNIEISKEQSEKLHYIKHGIYDLIFQNCFYIDNEFYFYDQEWIEENIPVEFIIFRAINYLANSKSEIDRNELYREFDLLEYNSIFEKLENILQEQIKDGFIWRVHATNNITVKNLYDTRVHYQNLEAQAQQDLLEMKDIKNEEIKIRDEKIKKLTKELNYMKNSKSWKVTKIFRNIWRNMNIERKELEDESKKEN